MRFHPAPLRGAFIVELEPRHDERGFFARNFCRDEFAAAGIESTIVQVNISENRRAGTLRGLHYQAPPREEAKLVSCIQGSMYDVIVDVREDSPSFARWFGVTFDARELRALYVPKGFAHGFLTLTDDTRVLYQMFTEYHPPSARGFRWDDPAFAIEWPGVPRVISDRDRGFPPYGG